MLNEIEDDANKNMNRAITALQQTLVKIRTGRAHPGLLSTVKVDYYGQMTELNQVASVTVTDARMLTVTPFEKSMIEAVDRAIRNSGLGLNPVTAGQTIRVPMPPLTEETRIQLVKQVNAEGEKTKISIRNTRKECNNEVKKLLKAKEISEDEDRKSQDSIQKLTNKFSAEVDKHLAEKEQALMKV